MLDVANKLPPAPTLPPVTNYNKLEISELALSIPEAPTEEYKTIKESIRKNGIREPLWLFEGRILDGRHRYRAGMEVGYAFSVKDFRVFQGTYEQAKALVHDLNRARRHLTSEQKQDYARELIKENPNDSNRTIAKRCGLSHVTVGNLRKEGVTSDNVDKAFEKFATAWQQLNDQQQEQFVERFKTDLRELLAEV